MKKLILLSAAGLLWLGADAQQANQSVVRSGGDVNAKVTAPLSAAKQIQPTRYRNNAKVTATPFFTETFGSGTRTSLPTGWTATAGTGLSATWKWTNTASTGGFGIGAINSTTANDGWMIYDSDSIGDLHPTVLPLTGSLISPTINCSTHPSVLLTFQSYFRKFRDSTYVDVSNNGGTSWTTFHVKENNEMGNNTTNAKNPMHVRINISSVAANQSNVMIRFRYVININSNVGGTFNWLIDDVAVSEIDPIELSIDNSAMYMYGGGNLDYVDYFLFSNYPRSLADSMLAITYITNNGLNSVSSVPVNASVFYSPNNGTTPFTQVWTGSTTYPNIPVNGVDSTPDWGGFRPTQVGNYVAAFSVNATGDAFALNNVDTQRFNITDTMLSTYGPTLAGGFYLHRAAPTELSYQQGARFDIPAGRKDTLSSVSVSFDNDTDPGVNTVVQIYRMTGTSTTGFNWTPVGTTRPKTLTTADISPATGAVTYTSYPVNTVASGGVSAFVLDSGTYAAIVKTIGALPNQEVVINAAIPIVDRYNISGYYGQADTADNASGYSFSPVGIATGTAGTVPLVRINFGTIPKTESVATINGVVVGDAYPNPANNTLNVPVTVSNGAAVNVSISNMIGQTLMTQTLSNIGAGQTKNAVFNTSDLAPGIYLYTVESNGERVSNRVVIAH